MVVQIVTMLVQYFLYSLFLTPAALALNVHQNHDQQPLLPIERPQLTNVYSQHASVMLGYTEHGSNQEKAVEIPLNTRVWSGRGLAILFGRKKHNVNHGCRHKSACSSKDTSSFDGCERKGTIDTFRKVG